LGEDLGLAGCVGFIMRLERLVLRCGLWVAAIWLTVCVVVGVVAADWALHPMRRAPTLADVERRRR